jgi:hypothetical protein
MLQYLLAQRARLARGVYTLRAAAHPLPITISRTTVFTPVALDISRPASSSQHSTLAPGNAPWQTKRRSPARETSTCHPTRRTYAAAVPSTALTSCNAARHRKSRNAQPNVRAGCTFAPHAQQRAQIDESATRVPLVRAIALSG